MAVAALVGRLYDFVDLHISAEARIFDEGGESDVTRAELAAECEASVALALTRTATRDMITVAKQLEWRLHAVAQAFADGDLDYARVRTIAIVLSKACDDTVAAIEADVLAAALRCSTKALRERIWGHWIAYDETEANGARKRAESEERCASIKRGDDGMATLFAKMTMLEGAECDSILDELAGTVCARDPRTKKQLRGHALIALIHREQIVACLCGRDDCPVRGASEFVTPRRPHLVQLMVGVETLLGMSNEPATLGDGTVIDPETARMIAGSAQWQMLLTEMLAAAQSCAGHDSAVDGADVSCAGSPSQPRAVRIVGRGRKRRPAPLPDRKVARHTTRIGHDVDLSQSISAFLAAAAANPALAQGVWPDGHGGVDDPPPGALTYRPSAELVALTRATHCTCTFPGCSVPAARCEIDHIVPFDHTDPAAGGWTIASNLQPLCGFHHQAKTLKLWAAAKLNGDGIFWTSASGLRRITPSAYGTVVVPTSFVHKRRPTGRKTTTTPPNTPARAPASISNGPTDELYEATWWETHIGEENAWGRLMNTDHAPYVKAPYVTAPYVKAPYVPTLGDIARLTDPLAREEATYLRERFLEHRAIVAAREHHRPPPF